MITTFRQLYYLYLITNPLDLIGTIVDSLKLASLALDPYGLITHSIFGKAKECIQQKRVFGRKGDRIIVTRSLRSQFSPEKGPKLNISL